MPALSLVALRDGEPAGHVAISRAQVAPPDGPPVEVLALGPIGVLPARQRQGLGSDLMRATLAAAAGTAWPLIALLGHADYYPRFGFEPAGALGSSARTRPRRSTGWRTACPPTSRRCAARSATRRRSTALA